MDPMERGNSPLSHLYKATNAICDKVDKDGQLYYLNNFADKLAKHAAGGEPPLKEQSDSDDNSSCLDENDFIMDDDDGDDENGSDAEIKVEDD